MSQSREISSADNANGKASSEKVSMLGPIFGSHVERIGLVRTIAGAVPMYGCIPSLVIFNLALAVVMYQWLFRPLLGLPRIRWADYVIIDRHRIEELTWFDKFNCMFCGYANGLCTMINQELDHTAAYSGSIALWKKPIIFLFCLVYFPVHFVLDIYGAILYGVLIAPILGMHRPARSELSAVLVRENYAGQLSPLFRWWLRKLKVVFLGFAMSLEQIESSWCPLRHFERRKGVVYPEHHKKFFGPDEIREMREVLRSVGTVSDLKPKW